MLLLCVRVFISRSVFHPCHMINQPAPILNFEWEACSLQGSIRRAPSSSSSFLFFPLFFLPPVRPVFSVL